MSELIRDPAAKEAYDKSIHYQYIVLKLCEQTHKTIYLTGTKGVYISAEIATKEGLSSEECQKRMEKCFMSMTKECLTSQDDPRYFIFRFVVKCDKGLVDILGFFLWCPDEADAELLSIYKAKKDAVCACFPGVVDKGDYTTSESQDCGKFIASLYL